MCSLWSAVASGIPRDTAFKKPRKAVPCASADAACHRTPKRSTHLHVLWFFVEFVVPTPKVTVTYSPSFYDQVN
jgi:hypothetical protein